MKRLLFSVALALTTRVAWTAPEVDNVTAVTGAGGVVTVSYELSGAPAIVTFDILQGETSIGAKNLWFFDGDINRRIETDGAHTFTYDASQSWKGSTGKSVVFKVTAHPLSAPPLYLVADVLRDSDVAYYDSVDALPGGLLENCVYRTSKIVFRRIDAKGVEWTMGADPSTEPGAVPRSDNGYAEPHQVTLSNNYYIGVFELTSNQFRRHYNSSVVFNTFFHPEQGMRPWCNNNGTGNSEGLRGNIRNTAYPNDPASGCVLYSLREKTGLRLDLPSEAQWEYAAKAGSQSGCWPDGSPMNGEDADPNLKGRYLYEPGVMDVRDALTNADGKVTYKLTNHDVPPSVGGTAIVGSYPPNDFGLYDMCGNVAEYCLDWYQPYSEIPEGPRAHGDPNVNGAVCLNGEDSGTYLIFKGGGWADTARKCHPSYRWHNYSTYSGLADYGARLALTIDNFAPAGDEAEDEPVAGSDVSPVVTLGAFGEVAKDGKLVDAATGDPVTEGTVDLRVLAFGESAEGPLYGVPYLGLLLFIR